MTSTTSKSVTVTEIKAGIALVTIDMPGSSANVLTTELFAELDETLAKLQQQPVWDGLIIWSAKPGIFVAGADLKQIVSTLDWPDERIIGFCEQGRAVMARLSQMPFVTVAAIHGACVGGGLELALWCDRRIASADRKTNLGLPEVKLGLVPGWAGTVRLPRIASLEVAIDLVTSGRQIDAQQAMEFGFIDGVTSRDGLLDAAVAAIENEREHQHYRHERHAILSAVNQSCDLESLREKYAAKIVANQAVFPFAPEIALQHLLSSAALPHDQACHNESLAMAVVYGSEPSYGLLNHFFLGEHNRKHPGFVDTTLAATPISRIGIVGAGLMGTNIAEICLRQQCDVVLFDASAEALRKASETLAEVADNARSRFQAAGDYSDFGDCDLVLESVVEVEEIKKSVLQKIESVVSEQAIIATGTSAIPVARLSAALRLKDRLCGIHFCHPQLMELVELIKGECSSPQTMASVTAWIRKIRKMPVVVKDHAGFVVNRLLAAMLDQSVRLYGWGYGIAQIDDAMRLFGFRGGPFEIVDIIGVEVCMHAGREMYDASVKSVTMTPILPRMVKNDWLGRKTGQGFYRYGSLEGDRIEYPAIDQLLASYVDRNQRPEFNSKQMVESICAVIVLEATAILDQQIIADPKDIDLCIINGFSFPAHVGGILFWADRFGIDRVNAILNQLGRYDAKLLPGKRLLQMEADRGKFYG